MADFSSNYLQVAEEAPFVASASSDESRIADSGSLASMSRALSRALILGSVVVLSSVGTLAVAGVADLRASVEASRRLRNQVPERVTVDRRLNDHGICKYDDDTWVSQKWNVLSGEERRSWQTLGWSQNQWDLSWGAAQRGVVTTTTTLPPTTTLFGPVLSTTTTTPFLPMTEYMCWQDLTEDQRDAVTLLYGSASWGGVAPSEAHKRWRDCKKHDCKWPHGIPGPTSTCLETKKYLDSIFNQTRKWMNITSVKREKMVRLGWHPDGKTWVTGQYPSAYGKQWSELSVGPYGERSAATFLGYSPLTWENCEKATDSPCLDRLVYIEEDQRTWVWEELLVGTQEKLQELGWESRTWFEGTTPAVMKVHWNGLTNRQQAAARTLGYDQETFRGCTMATCLERFAYVKKRWKGIGWMQMKLSERRAWKLLGHSESLWNAGNNPSTMQMRWVELSPEQQKEAMFLGHSEGTWQGCNYGWTGRNTTGNATNGTVNPNDAVRGTMLIDRPYSEISGNVYGKQVATMPTSFIRVFEEAVGRALFCDNPPLSTDSSTYIGPDGEPLCVQKTKFEMQKTRIRVLNVPPGIIEVDFFITANATPSQDTSRLLFEKLQRQVEQKLTSPLCHDKYFGRFCKAAKVTENRLSSVKYQELNDALDGEKKRNAYDESNKCLLHLDAKLGVTSCGSSSAQGLPRSLISQSFAGALVALAASVLALYA